MVAERGAGRSIDDIRGRVPRHRPMVTRALSELREMLASAEFAPGDRLPSETELATRLGVARASLREALKILERDGLVDVQHGRGNFVSALSRLAVRSPITAFESVTEMLSARGITPATRVLSAERTQPTREEARALRLGRRDEVVRLRRVRLGDGTILIYSVNVFAASALGERDITEVDFSGSITELLAEVNHRPVSAAAHMRAISLPADVANFPEAGPYRAWLLIEELCIDADGEPILQSLDYHRGDLFSFHVLRRRGTINDD